MESFDKWVDALAKEMNTPEVIVIDESLVHDDLLDYNAGVYEGTYYYPCQCCGDEMEIEEPERFDPDYCYCGKNESCIP